MTVVPQDSLPSASPSPDLPSVYEQQPGESAAHFAWFCAFLEMGPGRSLLGAYKIFYAKSQKVSKSLNISPQWREASNKWNWKGRAGVWDNFRCEQRRRKIEAEEQEVVDELFSNIRTQLARHREIDKFTEFVMKYPRTEQRTIDGQTIISPVKWNVGTAIRAYQVSVEANKTAAELLALLGTLTRNGALREMASDSARQVMEARLTLEALGYQVASPEEGNGGPKTPTEMRTSENERMALLEMVLVRQVEVGAPGAVQRLLALSKRRAALNGLDKPFNPAAEKVPKKRKRLDQYSRAELQILEEILDSEEEE
jgi:hypothetical protein